SAWGHLFGSLAISWLTLVRVTDLANPVPTALQSALLLCIPILGAGIGIAWMFGRWAVLRQSWPLIAVLGILMGGGQVLVTLWDPVLAAFLPSFAAMLALFPLSRWKRFSEPFEGLPASRIMQQATGDSGAGSPRMSLGMALLPYVILTAVALLLSAVPPLHAFLRHFRIGLPFPSVTTGYGLVEPAYASYAPLAFVTHPGCYLLLTSLLTYGIYGACGYFRPNEERESLWRALARAAIPSSIAVISFLVTSRVMSLSGQTDVLALGISQVASPGVYAFASNWLGVVGAFTTSSTTASNALFGALQLRVAHYEGLSVPSILAAHGAGSAVGNAIAPADVVLGTTTAGNAGAEGAILRLTLPWTVVMSLLIGGGTLLLAGFGVP
ncbi:MAG TPA: L-lactate permease, partial [Stenomitos sp.]